MDKNYTMLIDALQNKTEMEPVFEKLKKWYAEKGINVFCFEMRKINNENVYELYAYSNAEFLPIGESHKKMQRLSIDAFKTFLDYCDKLNVYVDTEWASTLVYNQNITALVTSNLLEDFCKKETDVLSKEYEITNIQYTGDLLVSFKNDDVWVEYEDNDTLSIIAQRIGEDFTKYIEKLTYFKENGINIYLTNINYTCEDMPI